MTTQAVVSPAPQPSFKELVLSCWNWKCALMSATARSIVYLTAMMHSSLKSGLSIVLVEMAYVTLTAGLYAGLQQKALGLRSRMLGNLAIVVGVPGFSQLMDWVAHWATGSAAPARATVAVCIFALISALFHLHVMRRGAFLTGDEGRSLVEDFKRIPLLTVGFVVAPFVAVSRIFVRLQNRLAGFAAAQY